MVSHWEVKGVSLHQLTFGGLVEQAQGKTNSQASVKSPCPDRQSCALISENEFSELEEEKWLE